MIKHPGVHPPADQQTEEPMADTRAALMIRRATSLAAFTPSREKKKEPRCASRANQSDEVKAEPTSSPLHSAREQQINELMGGGGGGGCKGKHH